MTYRVGVDVGGTFTDLVAVDEGGRTIVVKTPSTPHDQSVGVLEAVRKAGIDLSEVAFLSHGATVGVNAVIENKGARVAIITTEGFRDVLELRRGRRVIDDPDAMYDLQMDLPQDYVGGYDPLVRRPLRFEVPERLDYQGRVVRPLDEQAVRDVAEEIRDKGVEAVAICFLFSFMNPDHERRTAEIVREVMPGVALSVSSEILPVIREYERLSTTTVNAYIMPAMRSYLTTLGERLRTGGFDKDYYLMQSSGGIMSAQTAAERPVYTIDSGPAAGVCASARLGADRGWSDIIAFDMGGTTAKVCVVRDGKPQVTSQFWVGGRYFIGAPVVDLVEIGAGGGSVVSIDGAGAVHVGPRSAGAVPGPACYGQGGVEPTVTDADLVLGYINPDYFLGGEMTVDAEAARRTIEEKVARPLGISVPEAAHGIYRLVNANMIGAMRIVTVQRGHDPRDHSMVLSGGTAAVHAVAIAQELRIPRVIIPPTPGAFSAVGLISADARYDVYRSYVARAAEADAGRMRAVFTEIGAEATAKIEDLGFARDRITTDFGIDMRYLGQAHEVAVAVPTDLVAALDGAALTRLAEMFHDEHRRLFGHASPEAEVEFITLTATALGPMAHDSGGRLTAGDGDPVGAYKGDRPVYFPEAGGYVACPTYERSRLRAGDRLSGPAVVEQMDTTIVLPPGQTGTVDDYGNIVVDVRAGDLPPTGGAAGAEAGPDVADDPRGGRR